MARVLAIDVGTSSAKAAVIAGGKLRTPVARAPFDTRTRGDRAEVSAGAILAAIAAAVTTLDPAERRRAERVAIAAMGASWVAMDARGRAVTPVVTHQDRRSVAEAHEIERSVGRARHLRLVGARPIPGGISSTTVRWFARHAAGVMRRADLIGHLPTLLVRRWCGPDARAIDLSHASFTGLYRTLSDRTGQAGWSDALCAAAGIDPRRLPAVLDARTPAGIADASAAADLGVLQGTPVLPGIMDGSVPLLQAGLRRGQVVNVVGSTDVLAACTDRPRPAERLLTRSTGVTGWWAVVGTMAATGTALEWVRRLCFAEVTDAAFLGAARAAAAQVADVPADSTGGLHFDPYLAGERTSIEQPTATLAGLRLSTDRTAVLRAVIAGLARAGAERVELIRQVEPALRRTVLVSGGMDPAFARAMHRRWPRPDWWQFRPAPAATLLGLANL